MASALWPMSSLSRTWPRSASQDPASRSWGDRVEICFPEALSRAQDLQPRFSAWPHMGITWELSRSLGLAPLLSSLIWSETAREAVLCKGSR